MGTEKTRQIKTNWFMVRIEMALDRGCYVSEDKLISEFCGFFFSTRRTAEEILDMLEDNGNILRKDGLVWTQKHYEAYLIEKELKNVGS